MMKVLIVYEMVPEESNTYVVDMTNDEFKKFSVLAGKFGNNNIDTKAEQEVADELNLKLDGDWKALRVKPEALLRTRVDATLLTGFVL